MDRSPTHTVPPDSRGSGGRALLTLAALLLTLGAWSYTRQQARQATRRCWSQQRVLAETLDGLRAEGTRRIPPALPLAFWESLVAEGVLPRVPEDPGSGPGSGGHYFVGPAGLSCAVHGSVVLANRGGGPSPREQLLAAGLDDPALLGVASAAPNEVWRGR